MEKIMTSSSLQDTSLQTTVLQNKIIEFLKQDLFNSAEKLGSFLICPSRVEMAKMNSSGDGSQMRSLELYADALFGKKEYLRSLNYYKLANQMFKLGQRNDHRANPSSSPLYDTLDAPEECDIKYKEAKCYLALNDTMKVIRCLEMIPPEKRTLQMNLTLGATYLSVSGSDICAVESYKRALGQDPLVTEAIDALVELGVGFEELKQLTGSCSDDGTWMHAYIVGLVNERACQHGTACVAWDNLDQHFPNNPISLLHLATLLIDNNRLEDCQYYFKKARAWDTLNMDGMDQYAYFVRTRGVDALDELQHLAQDLSAINPSRAEPWLAFALWKELSGHLEEALGYVEKALKHCPRSALSYRVRGELMLKMEKPHDAVISFFKAKELRHELNSYQGLVTAYLKVGKLNDALTSAKEAVARFRGSRAIVLLGQVLASEGTTDKDKERAKVSYLKALSLDPKCIEAMLALADLHLNSYRFDKAIEVLKSSLSKNSSEPLHTKLGDVYAAAKQFDQSLGCYHSALAMNPESYHAKVGLEKLEKLMRGIDPDMENDDNDSDAEVDSAELDTSLEGAQFS